MKTTQKWNVRDVITTVLLTVLLIVIQLIVNMVCMANDFVSMVLSVGFTMFLCAPVYFLMVSRVHKRFVTLIYMIILGFVFLIMGNWYLLPYYIIVGIICEAILWRNGWESKKKMTAAWSVASLLYNGVNLLPIWFFWDTYEAFALSSGMEQSYIDSFVRYYTSPGWLTFIILFTVLGGFLGSLVGGKLVNKHFKKSGSPLMNRRNLAVPVKLWALACAIIGISLTADTLLTCVLTVTGFIYLGAQRNWRLLRSMAVFYAVLGILLYLIRFHDFHPVVFSEFYVLMFWNLTPVFLVSWDLITTPPGELAAFLSRIRMPSPVILGLLVMFRFFPTMKSELRSVWLSMRNRGLTAPTQLVSHPAASCEYVLVPLLLRCLQIADQLSVSAVARGAECPGKRGSYYGKRADACDSIWMALWTVATAVILFVGGVRI